MKNKIIIAAITCVFVSCSHEKQIQKTNKEGFLKNEKGQDLSISGVNVTSSENPGSGNSRVSPAAYGSFIEEIRKNNIPTELPNKEFPDWQKFSNHIESIKSGLSPAAKQYCAELLLKSYNLSSISKPEKRVIDAVVANMTVLVTGKYKGYELIYHHLLWLRNNGYAGFAHMQSQVISYAKPVLGPPDPNLKNDPAIESNPAMKEELERMITKMKLNDSFIEKIKSL